MAEAHDGTQERREYVRVPTSLPIRYRFLSNQPGIPSSDVLEGKALDMSGGGISIRGPIPDIDWVPHMLNGHIVVGLNLDLPDDIEPVRALARVCWVDQVDGRTAPCLLGLRFKEITRPSLDRIFQFVIRWHLT